MKNIEKTNSKKPTVSHRLIKFTDDQFEPFLFYQNKIEDERGWLNISWQQNMLKNLPRGIKFKQEVEIFSTKGSIRGFHFQKDEYAQSKLIKCVYGIIQNVIIDLRPESLTFGESKSFILESEDMTQLFIPSGFANAFLTISDESIVSSKVDKEYNEGAEYGIQWDDPNLDINWKFPSGIIQVSEKDKKWPTFKNWSKNKK
jgi:dTDP-4-dehydrorhamnose 3,5-epimerase